MDDDSSIEDYIEGFPDRTREKLEELRAIIRSAVPNATERISYDMPSFRAHGNLVYYAGYKTHVGLYGTSGYDDEMAAYRSGKGTLRFPLDRPLPADAIARVVKAKAEANAKKESGARD